MMHFDFETQYTLKIPKPQDLVHSIVNPGFFLVSTPFQRLFPGLPSHALLRRCGTLGRSAGVWAWKVLLQQRWRVNRGET